MNKISQDALTTAWELLFTNFRFKENEYAEIAYTGTQDKIFNRCFHVKSVEELKKVIQELGIRNYAIAPNTRTISEVGKRTNESAIGRQRIVILDVEWVGKKRNKALSEDEIKELLQVTSNALPKEIKDAVRAVAFTGGGCQLWLELSRVIESAEVRLVYDWLRRSLYNVATVDPNALKPAQLQRLIGTINIKYTPPVQTRFLKIKNAEEVIPLDVDNIQQTIEWVNKSTLENEGRIKQHKEKIKDLRDVIEQIKKRVRFSDIYSFSNERKGHGYTSVSCPFHTPDHNPSFVIKEVLEGYELAFDNHDGEVYDVIKFYQKENGVDFISALKALAKIAGVQLNLSREAKREAEKNEALRSFDAHAFVNELGIREVFWYKEDEEIVYELKVEDIDGEIKTIKAKPSLVLDHSAFIKYLANTVFGIRPLPLLPVKAEREAWNEVLKVIQGMAKREEQDVKSWDALYEELKRIFIKSSKYNADPEELVLMGQKEVLWVNLDGEFITYPQKLWTYYSRHPVFDRIKNLKEFLVFLKRYGFYEKRINKRGALRNRRLWVCPSDLTAELNEHILKYTSSEPPEGGATGVSWRQLEQPTSGATQTLENQQPDIFGASGVIYLRGDEKIKNDDKKEFSAGAKNSADADISSLEWRQNIKKEVAPDINEDIDTSSLEWRQNIMEGDDATGATDDDYEIPF